MRFIDADKLPKYDGYALSAAAVAQAVENAPTIEAEPIRHGRWIIKDNPDTEWYQITCSECREDVTSTAPCIGFFPNAKVLWDYCPHCGAKMDAPTQKSVGKALETLEANDDIR